MRTENRRHAASVIARLAAEPYRFQLTQAVRLLVRWLGRQGVPQDRAWTQVLRFENSLRLGFPASEIESLRVTGVAGLVDAPDMLRRQGSVHIAVTPSLIGLLGVQGALPLHHTERIATLQSQAKDGAPRAFVDLLSHRMVALYCQAWGKYRLEHALDMERQDTQLRLLLSLAGTPQHAYTDGVIAPEAGAFYAALLSARPMSAAAIGNIVADYFQVPVKVRQFVGGWEAIPPARRNALGGVNTTLGYGAALGTRMWRQDRRLRLLIGPLDPAGLRRFLPTGSAAIALSSMLTLFATPGLAYEVRLLLDAACVRPLVLRRQQRLGWDTFLQAGDHAVGAKEIGYLLQPAGARSP